MKRFLPRMLCAALALTPLLLAPTFAAAATLREQRDDLRRAATHLKAAVRLAEQDRPDDAIAQFAEAQAKVQAVGQELDPKLQRTFARTEELLAETHKQLTAAGLALPELGSTEPTGPRPDAASRDGMPEEREGRFARGRLSFVNEVAPLLAEKCGRCHVERSQGGFSLATYNSLIQGSESGRVLIPGEGTGGVLMDNLESGAMPPGRPLAPEEMTLISTWITQGARFDGDNPDANLKQLKEGAAEPMAEPEQPMPARATGAETVSFAVDVAPILMDRCANCHVADNRGRLRFASFQQLLGGSVITPGDPDGSELIRRVRPDADRRMPQGGPPLTDQQIATLTTWVQEGARFDGQTPTETLDRSTSFVRAQRATPEELTSMRAQLAADAWRLGIPDEPAHQTATTRYLLVGSVPEQRLAEVGDQAEAMTDTVQKAIGLPVGKPLGKARHTLFVFDQQIDYREFVQMVEKRQLDSDSPGHARFDPVQPYACLAINAETDGAGAALAQQVAALAMAEHAGGRAPDWFVEGAARYAAAKSLPKDELARQWIEGLASAASGMTKPDAFMTGAMPPEDAGVVAMHFVAGMARNARALAGLIEDVGAGKEFDAAFAAHYKAPLAEVAKRWAQTLSAAGR